MPCAAREFGHCEHDPAKCAEFAREFRGVKWQTCPVRELLDDEDIPELLRLERQHEHFPLRADDLAPWAVDALIALREERAQAEAQAIRVARGGGHG